MNEPRDSGESGVSRRRRSRRWLLPIIVLVVFALVAVWVLVPRGPPNVNSFDFTLPEATSVPPGRPWHLADHLAQGKPVLIEFIAPIGVAPVQRMLPVLRDLQNGTYGSRIQIVSVAIDIPGLMVTPTLDLVATLAHESNTTWPYLVEANGTHAVRDLYNVTGVPTFVIVRGDGSLAWREVGVTDLATLEAGVRQVI